VSVPVLSSLRTSLEAIRERLGATGHSA
jgi:hypothetical protein